MTLAQTKSRPGYGVESISASHTPIYRHAALDLGPPLCVRGCHVCGQRDRDEAGHWTIGLDSEGRPVCKRHGPRKTA